MDEHQISDGKLDLLLAGSAPKLAGSVVASALAMPEQVRTARRRRGRWAVAGILAGVLTLGGTAAIAAPLLLQPIPGYSKVVAFSYGVEPGEPGIRCQTIVAVKPTPDDPKYDAAIVERFSDYIRSQQYSIPVPAKAREPYTGGAGSTSTELYKWPGTQALNTAYSRVMGDTYARFDSTDPEERRFGSLDPNDPLSHSLMIQDTVSCTGHP